MREKVCSQINVPPKSVDILQYSFHRYIGCTAAKQLKRVVVAGNAYLL